MYGTISASASNSTSVVNASLYWPTQQTAITPVNSSASTAEPRTIGTNGDDYFPLDDKTRGLYWGNGGNDNFDYKNAVGKLNTRIAGGVGADTFSLSGFTADSALKALKDNNYTFIMRSNGFVLRTQDNQEVQVANVEKIAFSDKTFDLTNAADAKAFVDAIKAKGVKLLDERTKPALSPYANEVQANNSNPRPNPQNLIPINRTGYPQNQNGFNRQTASNISPEQAYFMGLGYAVYQQMMAQGNGLTGASQANSFANTYGVSAAASAGLVPIGRYDNPYSAPVYGFGASASAYADPYPSSLSASASAYANPYGAMAVASIGSQPLSNRYSEPDYSFADNSAVPVFGMGMTSMAVSNNTNNYDFSHNITVSSIINN